MSNQRIIYQNNFIDEKHFQSGVIATAITLGVFLILGILSLASSVLVSSPQTTKTNAQSCAGENESITDQVAICCSGLQEDSFTLTCRKPADVGMPTSTPAPVTATPQTYSGTNSDCSGKLDITGVCNPACCTQKSDCTANGPNQTCSVQNGYCKSGLSCAAAAQGQTTPLYGRICGGASNGTCGWQFCNGTTIHDPVRNIDVPCQADENTAPAPMCQGDPDCAQQVTSNTCFYMTDEIFYNQGQGFDHHVKFWSPPGGGDGHIWLNRNGGFIFNNVWNKNVNNPFVVEPEWAGHNLGSGTFTFDGSADTCGKIGMGHASVSCTTGLNSDGKPYIRGASCEAKNFTSAPPVAVPTQTPITSTSQQSYTDYQQQCTNQPDRASGYFTIGNNCYSCDNYEQKLNKVDDSYCKNTSSNTAPAASNAKQSQVNQITGKCHDETGKTLDCSSGGIAENYTNPANPNIPLIRFIRCGSNGTENEACIFTCFTQSSLQNPTTGLTTGTQVECAGGDFGRIDVGGPLTSFSVKIINAIGKDVIIKSVAVEKTFIIGNWQNGFVYANPNAEVAHNALVSVTVPGADCGAGLDRNRAITITYVHKDDQKTEIQQGPVNYQCSSRPVIIIAK